ncbi:hypothetical protein UlMin_036412 [Ulmus minor]
MKIDQRVVPPEINHSFHHHTLIYRHLGSFYCDSCHKLFEDAPSYHCYECNFDLDVECGLMAPIRCEGQEHIEHFSHQHPMPLVLIDPQHHIQCCACQSLCSGPTYACTTCEYFLHKSCAELPLEIQHPSHSFHPLFLRETYWSFTCNICKKEKENAFTYDCKQCSEFHMCVKCYHASISPSIKYRYHEHLLCFIEDFSHLAHCKASDNYCHQPKASDDLHHLTNSVFLCLNCDFKIHFICGPLPSTIKHECHMHPLILIDSVVDANSENYYCDVCEFERNPRIRVYHCKECQYIVHPHCVISEIAKVFKGDLGGVTLKVIGQDFWEQPQEEWDMSSSFTLLDLLSSNHLDELEKGILEERFKWDKSSKGEEDSKVEVADEDIDEIITRYPFFNQQEDLTNFFYKDFDEFCSKEKTLVVKSSELSLKIVRVQGYSIPVTLAPILQTLLHKYPDISSDSKCTLAMKSICFFFLCKLINSMCTTTFADITKNLLRHWFFYMGFVNDIGEFRIDFVEQHLKMVTGAFFGLQMFRLETEIPTILNNKLEKLQTQIIQLNEYKESSSKHEFIKEHMHLGGELKWKAVAQDLF